MSKWRVYLGNFPIGDPTDYYEAHLMRKRLMAQMDGCFLASFTVRKWRP